MSGTGSPLRRSTKRSHNSLQRSPGASLSRAGIIITLESLPARDTGRAGREEEGWLQPMGSKEGEYQVFQVGNGSKGISLCHTGG